MAAAIVEIEIPMQSGGTLEGVVAFPEGDGPHPGVLVISDAFGMTDDLRRITARFADNGYTAIAPDVYSHRPRPLCVARVVVDLLTRPHDATLNDLAATRDHLAELPGVDGERLAVIGFCMGGGFALAFAAQRGGVQACSNNYGAVPRKQEELEGVCPVIGAYGAKDKMFRREPRRLEDHMNALGIPNKVKVFPGVGHGFMNDHRGHRLARLIERNPIDPMHNGYDEDAAEENWARILAFFAEHV